MRLAVFGGAFDPPHAGHAALAEAARTALGLDRILWVPTFAAPHRGPAASAFADRLAMVRALTAATAANVADDIESHLPAPSYTLQTLEALRERHGTAHDWHLLIGSDNWSGFADWHRPDAVRALARIVVYPRAGHPVGAVPDGVTVLKVPGLPERSTDFRAWLRRDRETALGALPEPVADCIRARGLYREADA